ncbi:hypothetical protein DFJ73DRAFT_255251, partial [Zopfochytrium polystomum]
ERKKRTKEREKAIKAGKKEERRNSRAQHNQPQLPSPPPLPPNMPKKVAVAKKSLVPKKSVKAAVVAGDDVAMEDVQVATPKNKKAAAKTTTTTTKTTTRSAALTNAVVATDLPAGTSEAAISAAFSKLGEVTTVRLVKNSETEAIIAFSTEDEAEAAIAAGSITVGGKKVTVRAPKEKQAVEPSPVLLVRNLPYSTSPANLKKLFSPFGNVVSANVPRLKGGQGKIKGHGGVTFSTVDEATAALEALDGSVFEGRTIAVRYAKQK